MPSTPPNRDHPLLIRCSSSWCSPWSVVAATEVRLAQVGALDLVADAGEDQRALLHDQRPVGVWQDPDVLLDDDHRDAVVVDLLDDLEHDLGEGRAESERGLVDQ